MSDLNTLMDTDEELFRAGYEHVDSMMPRADGDGGFPWWHGWALREAFWLGALWQKKRGEK